MSVPGTMARPVYRLYRLAWTGLDWVFPPRCGGCGEDGSRWCGNCQRNTQTVPDTICRICGRIMDVASVCDNCREAYPAWEAVRSWAVFGGSLRNAIHRLKYDGDISLADVLARPMLRLLHKQEWQVELVVPVPMGSSRRAERGYNQAALLALPLAFGSGLPYRSRALTKLRDTRSQVGLSIAQRRENVAGAFVASERLVGGKRVLVVDDVMTSGATLESCARALKEAGAVKVYGLTLARAGFNPAPEFLETGV